MDWGYWCGNASASPLVATYCKRPQNQSLLRSISSKGQAPPRARGGATAGSALLLAALLLPALGTWPAGSGHS